MHDHLDDPRRDWLRLAEARRCQRYPGAAGPSGRCRRASSASETGWRREEGRRLVDALGGIWLTSTTAARYQRSAPPMDRSRNIRMRRTRRRSRADGGGVWEVAALSRRRAARARRVGGRQQGRARRRGRPSDPRVGASWPTACGGAGFAPPPLSSSPARAKPVRTLRATSAFRAPGHPGESGTASAISSSSRCRSPSSTGARAASRREIGRPSSRAKAASASRPSWSGAPKWTSERQLRGLPGLRLLDGTDVPGVRVVPAVAVAAQPISSSELAVRTAPGAMGWWPSPKSEPMPTMAGGGRRRARRPWRHRNGGVGRHEKVVALSHRDVGRAADTQRFTSRHAPRRGRAPIADASCGRGG